VACNRRIKFGALLDAARELGAELIATGHHARIIRGDSRGIHVARGADPAKDQSYFLSRLTPEQLTAALFPVGEMSKDQVRAKARELGLSAVNRPESQDVCFSSGNANYAEILRARYQSPVREGFFIEAETGERLGRHRGVHLYTIGQRKGLGIALGRPAYVTAIDPAAAAVFVSTDESRLWSSTMTVSDLNWQMDGFAGRGGFACLAQIRYQHRAAPAEVFPAADGASAEVRFQSPQKALTPGQAAVLYDGDEVIAVGWIG
jgi:tRNA-specific 2-thiouridylase